MIPQVMISGFGLMVSYVLGGLGLPTESEKGSWGYTGDIVHLQSRSPLPNFQRMGYKQPHIWWHRACEEVSQIRAYARDIVYFAPLFKQCQP